MQRSQRSPPLLAAPAAATHIAALLAARPRSRNLSKACTSNGNIQHVTRSGQLLVWIGMIVPNSGVHTNGIDPVDREAPVELDPKVHGGTLTESVKRL